MRARARATPLVVHQVLAFTTSTYLLVVTYQYCRIHELKFARVYLVLQVRQIVNLVLSSTTRSIPVLACLLLRRLLLRAHAFVRVCLLPHAPQDNISSISIYYSTTIYYQYLLRYYGSVPALRQASLVVCLLPHAPQDNISSIRIYYQRRLF